MPELHIKPGFTYGSYVSFNKHRERIQKFRETGNLHRSKLGKAWFAHDAAYSDSKVLTKRTISDKIFKDRAYEIARDCVYISKFISMYSLNWV